jgi:ribosomal protein L11 methyltransferase
LIRLAVRVRREDADVVLAELLELAPGGVEEADAGEGVVEYAVYGAPGELPDLPDVEAAAGGALVEVVTTAVADDWADRWRAFHRPIEIADRLYVRPPWEEAPIRPGVIDLRIDPGRAFGTGAHATTRLCLELLADLARKGSHGSFCDLGCGSGVLAIAAAKLGYAPVEAVDSDRLAVDATNLNARDNGVALDVVRRANLREEAPPPADVIAANLMRPLLLRVAELIEDRPQALILSGLLDHEADEVAAAFAPLTERRRLSGLGWSALLLA